MTIEGSQVDNILRGLLQKNLKFQFKNKVFKQGKLLLYKQNNYYLVLTLQNSKRGNIKFEIPIPYEIETWPDEDQIYFDYRLIALAKKKDNLLTQLKNVKFIKESKFYDSILEIIILPSEEIENARSV